MTAEPVRLAWAAAAVGLWLFLVAVVVIGRFRARRAARLRAEALAGESAQAADWLVAFASQTGVAEDLAWTTARALSDAGQTVRVALLGDLSTAELKAARRALIVASTTGEGDPPDSLSWFVRTAMHAPADLEGLEFGLLALGDRTYAQYCGFGRALDAWLARSGARALFDRIEVDDGDAAAIRHWQHQIGQLTGAPAQPDWSPPAFDRWTLIERTHLNPGSPGGEAHLLAFRPPPGAHWSAGDIAEIGPPASPDAPAGGPPPGAREYSIASLPELGRLEIIVRRMTAPDGTPGLASGYLTRDVEPGAAVSLRIRTNRAFHGPEASRPLILIGAGTGLAGLRAHWAARRGLGHGGVWLMFGERASAHDAWLAEETAADLASGALTRVDRVFSRDADDRRYVQALIEAHADDVRAWVARGAALYVCGSLHGMAPGVDEALAKVLGIEVLRALAETRRYRRDVY